MPWKELNIVILRRQFIQEYLDQVYPSFSYLCTSYGISAKTGYKWLNRFLSGGFNNLEDKSRAPHTVPHRTPDEICDLIIKTKLAHINWGPKKVLDNIKKHHPTLILPADSTAGEILKREGLVKKRKKRHHVSADEQAFDDCLKSNEVWGVDYKGQFKLGNGKWCYPLTMSDIHSRYLLECQSLESTVCIDAKDSMEHTFREYGLPDKIRSDNGSPFSSIAFGGISKLSKWWIQLGIRPQRIKPGHPQQNGRHERMHKTLKQETTKPPAYNERLQQEKFNHFKTEYNHERSHEALQRRCPDDVYEPSKISYPEKLPEIVYDEGCETRKVKRGGEIKWRGHHIYISQVLSHDRISLKEIDNDLWEICYGFYKLGELDARRVQLKRATQWHQKDK
jgi:transposase InsO family protein